MSQGTAARPWVVAHRGARREAPENTAAAFDAALAHCVDGIEFDVQLTADGVPVIFHDDTLYRVTGRRHRLAGYSLARLRGMDFGGWFDPAFAGEPIMTLDEMLERYAGATDLYLEVKTSPRDRGTERPAMLVRETVACLKRHRRRLSRRRLRVLSFDARMLEGIHERLPDIHIMRNLDPPRGMPAAAVTPQRLRAEIASFYTAVDLALRVLSPALAAVVRQQGKQLFTYTCNSSRQLRRAMAAGVDGVITDRPGWLIRALAGREGSPCGNVT